VFDFVICIKHFALHILIANDSVIDEISGLMDRKIRWKMNMLHMKGKLLQ